MNRMEVTFCNCLCHVQAYEHYSSLRLCYILNINLSYLYHLLSSQCRPEKPVSQSQMYEPVVFPDLHIPAFLHGVDKQGSEKLQ